MWGTSKKSPKGRYGFANRRYFWKPLLILFCYTLLNFGSPLLVWLLILWLGSFMALVCCCKNLKWSPRTWKIWWLVLVALFFYFKDFLCPNVYLTLIIALWYDESLWNSTFCRYIGFKSFCLDLYKKYCLIMGKWDNALLGNMSLHGCHLNLAWEKLEVWFACVALLIMMLLFLQP